MHVALAARCGKHARACVLPARRSSASCQAGCQRGLQRISCGLVLLCAARESADGKSAVCTRTRHRGDMQGVLQGSEAGGASQDRAGEKRGGRAGQQPQQPQQSLSRASSAGAPVDSAPPPSDTSGDSPNSPLSILDISCRHVASPPRACCSRARHPHVPTRWAIPPLCLAGALCIAPPAHALGSLDQGEGAGWSEGVASMLATRARSPSPEASAESPETRSSSLRNRSADFEAKVRQCREHITKLAADTRKPAVPAGGKQGSSGRGGAPREASFLKDMASKLAFTAVASPPVQPPPGEAGATRDREAPIKAATQRPQSGRPDVSSPRSPVRGGAGIWAR
jgi:hypothetical protein